MTKVNYNLDIPTSNIGQVGLSYYAQSHRKNKNRATRVCAIKHFLEVQTFVTGEAKMKYKASFNSQSKPPMREYGSEIIQNGLTTKAKSKIKLASRCIQHINENVKGRSGKSSFVTLTFGKHVPSHNEAKRLLDNFLKRTRRHFKFNFEYVWVAELQKRGAIHFHILLADYIPKEFVNQSWNEIVNKWSMDQHGETQKLYPHVEGVYMAGAYMSKYISKEANKIHGNLYNISSSLRKVMKPTINTIRLESESEAKELIDMAQDTLENLHLTAFKFNSGTTSQLWTNNGLEVIKSIENNILTSKTITNETATRTTTVPTSE